MNLAECIASAREVLRIESQAVKGLADRIDERFFEAVERILECRGRVVVSGMGKAGLVGRKIQATLASTGTPAIFLHPAEAIHGDLGMVLPDDVVLSLSNSGETEEIVRLLPHIKKIGAQIVAITASATSTLGRASEVVLEIGHIAEACPLGLAPSASTAAMMALGDALALTLQKARSFTTRDYATFHPGGDLGRRLMTVGEVMRKGEDCPRTGTDEALGEVVGRLTRARAGCVSVVDAEGRLQGVFTDGDFRRLWVGQETGAKLNRPVGELMTSPCVHIRSDKLVAEAMGIFRDKRINALPVVNVDGKLVGLLDVQDIVGLRIEP